MPGFKGFKKIVEQGAINKMAQAASKKLVGSIKKEDFLEQLENAWIPFVKKDANVEEEVIKARERIDKSAFKDAFRVIGITDEDLRQIINNIKET